MSNSYKEISNVYDLIHLDKNYKKESEILKSYINRYSNFSKIKNILDFGCGTCRHLEYLIEDKKATGVDVSIDMIEKAKKKKIPNLTLYFGNISTLESEEKFDLCTSMFHVINHIDCVFELKNNFTAVYNLLNHNSLFIFDCLNGVAFFRDKPRDRDFKKQINEKTCHVVSKCSHNFMDSKFTMVNQINIENKSHTHTLTQSLWTPWVLKNILNESGFEVLTINKNFTNKKATIQDYKICFIARKR